MSKKLYNLIEDCGPAFPISDIVHPSGQIEYGSTGMSLRDYFAAAAVTGLFAAMADPNSRGLTHEQAAHEAYKTADAMIEARNK